jgi:hypothetical protein
MKNNSEGKMNHIEKYFFYKNGFRNIFFKLLNKFEFLPNHNQLSKNKYFEIFTLSTSIPNSLKKFISRCISSNESFEKYS